MSLRVSSAAFLVCVISASCTHALRTAPASRLELRRKYAVHRVQKDETLYAIARRYGVSVDSVAKLNELDDPSKLGVGQELLIPGVPPQVAKLSPSAAHPEPDPIVTAPDAPPPTCTGVRAAQNLAVSGRGFVWPVDGVVISKFGKREGLGHEGIDIAAPLGTPIHAAAKGQVLYAGEQAGYGLLVIVQHDEDRVSIYARNAVNCVQEGAQVARGDVLGLVGQSGGAATPFVHFELREGAKPVNPRAYLGE